MSLKHHYTDSEFPYKIKAAWPENWDFRFSGIALSSTTEYWWKPWLLDNIGEENIDWCWDIRENNDPTVEFCFKKESDLTLFKLAWC